MSELVTLLTPLAPAARCAWALAVARRAVARLPATDLRRAVLDDALCSAFPPDAPPAPPTVRAHLYTTLRTLTDHDPYGLVYYATLTVAWLLRGATATPAATLVGVSAEWAAIADAVVAEGEAARQVERAWQRAQATAALTVSADPAIVAGIWGRGEEGRGNG